MGELEDFVGCTIKRDLSKMTPNISQPGLTNKMNKGFNKGVKSLMTLNILDRTYKCIVRNQETDTKISYNPQKRYRSGVGYLLYLVNNS